MLDVNMINPFISSAIQICQAVSGISLTVGKPYIRELKFDQDEVLIMLGVTGAMSGQVILSITEEHAKMIASGMCMGMDVSELNDMAISAISEMGNMVMGTAATMLSASGIQIDITPPIVQKGMVHLGRTVPINICAPLNRDGEFFMAINVLVEQKKEG